ncbi:MAG TPA: hypothetical protein DCY79_01005 [Planctomycetaceae bacterium]|nr:hypothetical protein [Blastopirellula sp.]HAY78364.1 hypothetical protein [Planctomycetaceae bacterium]
MGNQSVIERDDLAILDGTAKAEQAVCRMKCERGSCAEEGVKMRCLFAAICLSVLWWPLTGRAAELPRVEVTNIRRVFYNGEHNAFTDLIRFRNEYFLTFRSCPDGHMVHPTASIIVLRSKDLRQWDQVYRFRVPKRDTRDPHFLVFKQRLFIYTGTWYSGTTTLPREKYDLNQHLGYGVWTQDGRQWSPPTMLEGTFGHYVWRAAAHDGKAYLCGRRNRDFAIGVRGEGATVQSLMLESDDGLVWRKKSVFQEERGDETAFRFDPDGTLMAVGRRGSAHAQLLRSQPPYSDWERSDLGCYVGGPLLVSWGDRRVVGGRRNLSGKGMRTVMHWLNGSQLQPFAELPSDGDNSYPGWISLSDTRAVMSWYSSHEADDAGKRITAIYMADLNIAAK